MKVVMQQIEIGDEEIVVKYKKMTSELSEFLHKLSLQETKLAGISEENNENIIFSVSDVYYFETVNGNTYAYMEKEVYRCKGNLDDVVMKYQALGMVRCSRTMVFNLYKIANFRSESGAKLLATMKNGEKIIVSRKYARNVREVLKKEGR